MEEKNINNKINDTNNVQDEKNQKFYDETERYLRGKITVDELQQTVPLYKKAPPKIVEEKPKMTPKEELIEPKVKPVESVVKPLKQPEEIIEPTPIKQEEVQNVSPHIVAEPLTKKINNKKTNNYFTFTAPVRTIVAFCFKICFLSIITLGLYPIFCIKDILEEITSYLSHPQKLKFRFELTGGEFFLRVLLNTLLIIITFGIYSIFLPHKMIKWFLERTYIVDSKNVSYKLDGEGNSLGLILRLIGYPLLIIFSLGFATPYVILGMTEFILSEYISWSPRLYIFTKIGDKFDSEREHFVEEYLKTSGLILLSFGFYSFQGSKKMTNELLSLIEVSLKKDATTN